MDERPRPQPATRDATQPQAAVDRAIELLEQALQVIDDEHLGEEIGARIDHAIHSLRSGQR